MLEQKMKPNRARILGLVRDAFVTASLGIGGVYFIISTQRSIGFMPSLAAVMLVTIAVAAAYTHKFKVKRTAPLNRTKSHTSATNITTSS